MGRQAREGCHAGFHGRWCSPPNHKLSVVGSRADADLVSIARELLLLHSDADPHACHEAV